MAEDLYGDVKYSESSALNVRFSWTLNNFSELKSEPGCSYQSKYFENEQNLSWCLLLYPGGINKGKESSGDVLCCIKFGCVPKPNRNINIRLSLMNTLSGNFHYCVRVLKSPTSYESYSCGTFGKRSSLLKDLADDTLIIYINAYFSPLNVATHNVPNYIQEEFGVSEKLKEDYLSLWQSGGNYDITLIANGVPIPAHSLILSARSKTFTERIWSNRQMLSNRIEVTGFDEDTVKSLVQFIYSSTVDDIDYKKALELLRAAEEYGMDDLKTYCSGFLISNFSVGNICEVIIAADKCDDKVLKEKAIEYFCKNSEIINFSECLSTLKQRPDVLCEILERIK